MNSFIKLGLDPSLITAIEKLGFVEPTAVQEKTIPILLKNNQDLIALAQTGTGKTAAFGLPLIQLIDPDAQHVQALILAPTRELCMQITNDLRNFSANMRHLKVVAVYGGASIRDQMAQIRKGVQIVVATPGRLIDLIGRKVVRLEKIKYIVLDEADEMLNMGFQEDLDEILKSTPEEKLTWLFSATMPQEIRKISKKYMKEPFEITVGIANLANENIEHQYFVVHSRDKYLALKRILDYTPEIFGIIFCRTKVETQHIAEELIKDGYDANALHGDLNQNQRDKVMASFKDRTLQILVATDVAARGIDVDDVTHIIHLHLPDDMDFYTHRSGRTARAGKSGISMVLVSDRDLHRIKMLERKLKTSFVRKNIPTGKEVCEKQLLALIHKVHNVAVNEQDIAPFMSRIEEEFIDMSKQEILKRFASIEFNRFLDYYKDAKDLNIREGQDRDRNFTREDALSRNGDRIFINLGKMDDVMVPQLLELIDSTAGIRGKEIGNIKLKGAYSFFEIDPRHTSKVLQAFKGIEYNGRKVRVEVQNEKRDSYSSEEKSGRRYVETKQRSDRNRHQRHTKKFEATGKQGRFKAKR